MKNKGIKKSVRDEILVEIALQYRENQKLEQKPQKVRLFEIWQKQKMPYSDFIDVILALGVVFLLVLLCVQLLQLFHLHLIS